METDRLSNSRTMLDQLFWAGIEPPSKSVAQPSAEDARNERATALLAQASPQPVEPDRVLDTNNGIPPGQQASLVDSSAAADRDEPIADSGEPKADSGELKADNGETKPSQEMRSVVSPSVQPIPVEDADGADQQFQIEPQEAALSDAWIRCVAAAREANRRDQQDHAASHPPSPAAKFSSRGFF